MDYPFIYFKGIKKGKFLELGAGLGRMALGKDFLFPNSSFFLNNNYELSDIIAIDKLTNFYMFQQMKFMVRLMKGLGRRIH
jgi:hypothetical protein